MVIKFMRGIQNSNFNKGFTYIGLLLFIAITGLGLSLAGLSWQYQVRAEKEKQLLFVGSEFRDAINSYYASSPNAAKDYPASLNDLLLDKRLPNIKRHLRKVYLDPITGKSDWGFETQQGRIVGIYSKSTLAPYKQKGFNVVDANFLGQKRYKDWIFLSVGVENKSQSSPSSLRNGSEKNSVAPQALESNQKPSNNNSTQDKPILTEPTEPFTTSESKSNNKNANEPDFYIQDGLIRYDFTPSHQK